MRHVYLKAWLYARNKALRELDMDYVRKSVAHLGGDPTDEMLLLMIHKARYECTGIEDHYRHESRRWLDARGQGRMTGTPLLPEGELPE